MKLIKRFVLLYTLLILCACNNGKQTNTDVVAPTAKVQVTKENSPDYIQDLYKHYISNPTNQSHIDENIIIDYLVAEDLNMTRDDLGYYYIINKGDKDLPTLNFNDPVTAHYEGAFLDGKVFDSSYKRGEPLTFKVGQMIAAWNELLKKMKSGDSATLITPSRLAYKDRGFPGYVDPNTVLKFKIEVL